MGDFFNHLNSILIFSAQLINVSCVCGKFRSRAIIIIKIIITIIVHFIKSSTSNCQRNNNINVSLDFIPYWYASVARDVTHTLLCVLQHFAHSCTIECSAWCHSYSTLRIATLLVLLCYRVERMRLYLLHSAYYKTLCLYVRQKVAHDVTLTPLCLLSHYQLNSRRPSTRGMPIAHCRLPTALNLLSTALSQQDCRCPSLSEGYPNIAVAYQASPGLALN